MIEIRREQIGDVVARERLLDACFGLGRFAKTSERLREGRLPAEGLAFSAQRHGRIVGTLRLWHVEAGPGRPALLLGAMAVDPELQGQGLGTTLMWTALAQAEALSHGGVLLVGDAPYYERFGFSQNLAEGLAMPGPFDRARFLGLNLRRGALDGAAGSLRATGAWDVETDAQVARRAAA